MIDLHLTGFDAAVIGVMLMSCLFAFFRGFVREILSLGAWIGAAVVTIYLFPKVGEHLEPYFKNPKVAAGVGTLGLYITALIIFSMINMLILKFVKSGADVGMLDNLLGLIFGGLRGALIISLAYFLVTIAVPEKEQPAWLAKSVTRPYVEKGALLLAKVAPNYLQEISSLQKKMTAEAQADGYRSSASDADIAAIKTRMSGNNDAEQQLDKVLEGNQPMSEGEFSYLRAIPASFYSKALYRDVYTRWQGFGFAYICIVMLIGLSLTALVFSALSFTVTLERPFNVNAFIEQVPVLTFKDGSLSTDGSEPVFIHAADDAKTVFAIIDTTHDVSYWKERDAQAVVLGKKEWLTRKNKNESELRSYPHEFDQVVTHDTLRWLAQTVIGCLWIVPIFCIPFLLLPFFLFRILQLFLYGLFGLMIATFTKTQASYSQSVRLASVALTPVLVLSMVSWLVHVSWYTSFILAMVYLWFAMKANSTHA